MAFLNSSIPFFIAQLDNSFFYNEEPMKVEGTTTVEVFGITSIPRRCLMFSVMTEHGTQHARVPIHYLWKDSKGKNLDLDWLQLWDSFSYYFSIECMEYTKNSSAKIMLKDKSFINANYLFTIDWCLGPNFQLGYSEMQAGHKCGHVFWNEHGQLMCQPNNRIQWLDGGSFITPLKDKPKWKVFQKEFTCENSASRYISEEVEDYFWYNFKNEQRNISSNSN